MTVGHVRQRAAGSWELRYRAGSKTKTTTFHGNKRAAEKELRRLLSEIDQGISARAPARLTTGDWLQQWLEIVRGEVRPITHDRYETAVRAHLTPALGMIRLRDLSPRDIQSAFASWALEGKRRGTGGLARSTLGLLRKVLHAALQRALELELISRHPMAALRRRLPTGAAPEARVIDADAVSALLERSTGTPYHPAILLAAACGLRRGEACGVRWGNIHLATGEVAIVETRTPARRGIATGPTKTGKSRIVKLPAFAVVLLRQHRLAQAEQLLALGAKLDDTSYVCAHADGSPLHPSALSTWCRKFAPIGYHGIRHSHASLLLGSGAPIKAVSARLGHASATMTLSTYAHLLPGADEDAARRIDDLLSGSNPVAKRS